MPVVVPTTLLDRLWTILEAGAATPPLVLVGNRINQSESMGWLRKRTRTTPNSFPWLDIAVGVTGSHSGYARDETLAMERSDFLDLADTWEIERTEEVLITITDNKPNVDGVNALKEAVIDDVMRAGPRLGIPDLVYRVGIAGRPVFTWRQRETRDNEQPSPGRVCELRFFVVCLEDGRTSLTP